MIRVVVTDEDRRVREQLRTIIEDQPDMQVVATVATADQACAAVEDHRPHVVVVDLHLAGDAVDLCGQLRALSPGVGCIAHATGADHRRTDSRSNGAVVVLKKLDTSELIATIRQVSGVEPTGGADER